MLSAYLQSELIDWIRGNAFPSAPAAVYLSLHTDDPGDDGADEHGATAAYTRKAITFDSSGDVGADVEFAEATADYSADIDHIGLWDAASAGNFIVGGPLTAAVTITSGEIPRVKTGDVSVVLDKTS